MLPSIFFDFFLSTFQWNLLVGVDCKTFEKTTDYEIGRKKH